ncbi:MAG: NIP7 N-terminal domain-related protein [Promethearchaeota archaeon]
MLQFRQIKPNEYDLIQTHIINSFNLKDFESLVAPFEIIVGEGRWKEILLISEQMVKVFRNIKKYRNPYFMGIFFGDIKKNKFKISLEGITLISNYVEEKTVLTDSGEKKVLYGRNLTKQDLLHIPTRIKKNKLSILTNKNGEVLALGEYLVEREKINTLNGNTEIIKNIIDKGWYLRKGK